MSEEEGWKMNLAADKAEVRKLGVAGALRIPLSAVERDVDQAILQWKGQD